MHFDGPREVTVTRLYSTTAPPREVIEWYWGKDSLMPLSNVLRTACSQYQYFRRHALLTFLRGGYTAEEIMICASPGYVTITSTTTFSFPASLP